MCAVGNGRTALSYARLGLFASLFRAVSSLGDPVLGVYYCMQCITACVSFVPFGMLSVHVVAGVGLATYSVFPEQL